MVSFLPLIFGVSAMLINDNLAHDANWSIVHANGANAAFWHGDLVEICPFEELRLRLDAVLDVDVLQQRVGDVWTDRDGHKRVRIPIEVVRTDDPERIVAVQAVDLTIWEDLDGTGSTHDDTEPSYQPITCALDESFCIPKIVGIRLPDVNDDDGRTLEVNHTIILQFATATNRPDAHSRQAMEAFVVFPTYVGDELDGTWTDDKTLTIVVTALDENRVLPLSDLMNALVHTKLRIPETLPTTETQARRTIRGQMEVRLRVEPMGEYTVRLLNVVSPSLRVRSCGNDADKSPPLVVILENESLQSSRRYNETALPEPSVFIDGVLSHSGTEAFVLRHSTIEIEDPGSWSLNFWLLTDQDATGNFRTLFFNGNGTGQHRTASAWFRPDDRRLVLRVSTAANMDVGLESVGEIPRNEWVNIGVTMRNCSVGVDTNASVRPECADEAGEGKPWLYSMKLFVNGILDQDVRLFTPVLPNNGPLHLAASPWTDGFRGFTSQLRVYKRPIHDADHTTIYSRGRVLYQTPAASETCDISTRYNTTNHEALHPVRQISCLIRDLNPKDVHRSLTTQSNGQDETASLIYDSAIRLRSLCDPSSWYVLLEAAELGDPRALRDVGTAYVYGRLAFTESECTKSKTDGVVVPINHDKAKDMLLRALHKKEWTAARFLALLSTYKDPKSSHLQAGLYHLAAAGGRKDAFMVLGGLYASGPHENKDVAAYHYFHATTDASIAYHARGKQPLHEMNRLYDGIEREDELRKGQEGDDDELIQYQKMRADKDGDVEAMASMGDLYYWGARGLTRDHEQAYHYFHRAAERGHTSAQSAVAGMLLKGEGTKLDNVSAIEWYEKAALKNHTRALNGLGFIHYYGSGGMTENKTLALEFFERAAANQEEGDSIFNAGYCHANGLGTVRNMTRAIEHFEVAARKFGHFDAIHELGKIYWSGSDDETTDEKISRDSATALVYLKAASEAGTWGTSVRMGFEYFLTGQYERATVVYTEASEYGYRVATSNLAYLYDQKLLRIGDNMSEARALTYLHRANDHNGDKETLVRIGDFYYYGLGGLAANAIEALKWYTRASAQSMEAGAYNVGHMHEYGLGIPINFDRAERYYQRVLELAPPTAYEKHVAIQLALFRLRVRRWLGSVVVGQDNVKSPSNDLSTLPSLPGWSETEDDTWHSISTITSIALAMMVASVGAWFIRYRQ